MVRIRLNDLKKFCKTALVKAGASEKDALTTAEVLSETEAWGTHSHGVKNLNNYIIKCEKGGASLTAQPTIVRESLSAALVDAHQSLGMVSASYGMNLAIEKAEKTGIAIVNVTNSTHFGAAGYYSNMAAKRGMIGIAMSNVDPNMTLPGARCQAIGNSPFSYAAPSEKVPSVFLDIAMSNVAGLKVVKARNEGRTIPDTWIVDESPRPTRRSIPKRARSSRSECTRAMVLPLWSSFSPAFSPAHRPRQAERYSPGASPRRSRIT